MSTNLQYKIRTARKHHVCLACYWFDRSCYGQQDMDPDDWLIVEACKSDKWKIIPGQRYLYSVGIDGGEFTEFKGRLDMHNICLKYDLYPED